MTPQTKPCPECSGRMDKHTDLIEEPGITGYGKLTRVTRLATFYGCTVCHHCEEVNQ